MDNATANLIGSGIVAVSAAAFARVVVNILFGPRQSDELGFFENERRKRLRETSATFRYLEPLIVDLAKFFPPDSVHRQLQADLDFQPQPEPWSPQEFLATCYIEGFLVGLALAATIVGVGAIIVGLIVWAVFLFGYPEFMKAKTAATARERRESLKKRLPFTIDLLALMMEAGASFLEAAATVVRENPQHPLSIELQRVINHIERGEPRRVAMQGLHQRVDDEEVRELISSINQADDLGTPLSRIFRDRADDMRLKRSQWAERAAADAQVKITGPGFLIALACMVIVLAPFLLNLKKMF